jgi:hypothetical protein
MQVKRWTIKYCVLCTSRPDIIESERDGIRKPPSGVLRSGCSEGNLESAPVPGSLEALGQAADASLWAFRCHRRLDWLCAAATVAGALTVAAAQTKMLPFTEGAVAAIAGTVPLALRVEACKLVEADLLGRILCAEDPTTLPAMVAAIEQAKRRVAGGCRTYWGGAVGLQELVSTIGLY